MDARREYTCRRVLKLCQPPTFRVRRHLPLRPLGLAFQPLEVGISAVVEATDGSLSHWALVHPAARPDFHDRRGFVLRLGVDLSSPSAEIERDQP
jgi:hypothetical protein